MRRFDFGVYCFFAVLMAIAVHPAAAMSFQSMPTRSDGSRLADPDEQIENFTQRSQVGPSHSFNNRPAEDQFRNSWSFTPWNFGNDLRPRPYLFAPSRSHQ
jgi:hypothetical protein